MNGIHDMGGMAGFGPVIREEDEPVFHSDWERKAFAISLAGSMYVGPGDRFRHGRERIDPALYLTTSYYEQWFMTLKCLLVELGLATEDEIRTGRTTMRKELPFPAFDGEAFAELLRSGAPATRTEGRLEPEFALGETVRARNIEITGHTRLPRYVRGKTGKVIAHHGSHVFPDTNAHDRGECAQPLYTVRFEAKVLWGDNVERRDCVCIDLWEDYLEPLSDRQERP